MKTGFALFFLAIFALSALAQDVATTGFEHASGEDVLINLQGENHDFWIVSFFQPGDNFEEVRDQIADSMNRAFPDDTFQYGEVSLTSGFEYKTLFETLDLVGEPKRSKTTPQVLAMKDGEGYIIYGPNIGDAVVKRYMEVRDGKVFQ